MYVYIYIYIYIYIYVAIHVHTGVHTYIWFPISWPADAIRRRIRWRYSSFAVSSSAITKNLYGDMAILSPTTISEKPLNLKKKTCQ